MPRRRSGHADQQRQTSCSYRMQCVREKLFSKRVEPVYCTADMCVTTNIHMSIHYRPSSACSMLQSRSPLSPEQTFLGLSCCVCLHLIPRMPAVWEIQGMCSDIDDPERALYQDTEPCLLARARIATNDHTRSEGKLCCSRIHRKYFRSEYHAIAFVRRTRIGQTFPRCAASLQIHPACTPDPLQRKQGQITDGTQ